MNKTMIVCTLFFSACIVWPNEMKAKAAQIAEIFLDGNKNEVSKREVVKAMLNNPSATYFRCYQVELNDKLSLVKKKE